MDTLPVINQLWYTSITYHYDCHSGLGYDFMMPSAPCACAMSLRDSSRATMASETSSTCSSGVGVGGIIARSSALPGSPRLPSGASLEGAREGEDGRPRLDEPRLPLLPIMDSPSGDGERAPAR